MESNLKHQTLEGTLGSGNEDDEISVISFDLDDTLWHFQPVIERAGKIQHDWLVGSFPGLSELLHEPSCFSRYFYSALDYAKTLRMEHDLSFVRRIALKRLADDAGIEHNLLVDQAFERFIAARSTVSDHLFPGVVDTLRRLKAKGYILVSLTNGNCDLERVPELRDIFDYQISAASVGVAKPDAAIFMKMMEMVGVSNPSKVLHVGDSISSDVEGANACGIRTVWVNKSSTDGVDHSANAAIRCTSLLESVLSQL